MKKSKKDTTIDMPLSIGTNGLLVNELIRSFSEMQILDRLISKASTLKQLLSDCDMENQTDSHKRRVANAIEKVLGHIGGIYCVLDYANAHVTSVYHRSNKKKD